MSGPDFMKALAGGPEGDRPAGEGGTIEPPQADRDRASKAQKTG
jgi:hypothetical protein